MGHNVGVSHRRRQVAVIASQGVSVAPTKGARDSVGIAVSNFSAEFISGYRQGLFCGSVSKKILKHSFGLNQ